MMFTMRNVINMDDQAALLEPGVSDLSLSGDGNSLAESLLFHHCNAEEGFIDRFGVAGLFNVHEEKPSADGKLDPSSRLSTGLEAALTDFATIGKSTQKQFKREGMVNQEVLDRVKRPSSLQFDGAANVQRAGRLSIGKGTFGTGTEAPDLVRDEMHELATLITGCLWREPDCQAVRHHWVGKKKSHTKQIRHSDRYANKWILSQRKQLELRGKQGGNLKQVLRSASYSAVR